MDAFARFLPVVLHGMLLTVTLSMSAMILATILGLIGAWAKLSRHRAGRAIASFYTIVVRGMPPLVLMLLIYFGGQTIVNMTMDALGMPGFQIDPFVAGVGAIGFIFGAYLTETFRGGYLAIPRGEIEAGIAIGMSWATLGKVVVLHPLMRQALPGYYNIWLTLIKSCALVSVIGLQDAVYAALSLGRSMRQPFTFMLVVMVLYLLYTAVADLGFRMLRRRLERGTRATTA
jgi:His/Glu/Gln/Arg/opine family amino acid ABC transporter permease subunit